MIVGSLMAAPKFILHQSSMGFPMAAAFIAAAAGALVEVDEEYIRPDVLKVVLFDTS